MSQAAERAYLFGEARSHRGYDDTGPFEQVIWILSALSPACFWLVVSSKPGKQDAALAEALDLMILCGYTGQPAYANVDSSVFVFPVNSKLVPKLKQMFGRRSGGAIASTFLAKEASLKQVSEDQVKRGADRFGPSGTTGHEHRVIRIGDRAWVCVERWV
ncbi:MAG: hypothetical protein QW767_06145 [Thermoprotei archaeon]